MRFLKKIGKSNGQIILTETDNEWGGKYEFIPGKDLYGGGLGDMLEAYFALKNKKNPDVFDQEELQVLIKGLNQIMQLSFTK